MKTSQRVILPKARLNWWKYVPRKSFDIIQMGNFVFIFRPWQSYLRRCSCICRRCKEHGSFTTTCSITSWDCPCRILTQLLREGKCEQDILMEKERNVKWMRERERDKGWVKKKRTVVVALLEERSTVRI